MTIVHTSNYPDVEIPENDDTEVPTLNIEDLRRRYPARLNRSTWKERSFFRQELLW